MTKRGKIWWVEAMFPGYFFARFSLVEQGRLVGGSQGVTGIVRFNEVVPSVPEQVINEIRINLAEEDTITLMPEVEAGEEVEVAHGPFIGQKGEVSRVLEGQNRVAILLEFLGDTKEVEIDLFSLLLRRPSSGL